MAGVAGEGVAAKAKHEIPKIDSIADMEVIKCSVCVAGDHQRIFVKGRKSQIVVGDDPRFGEKSPTPMKLADAAVGDRARAVRPSSRQRFISTPQMFRKTAAASPL